VRGWHGSGYGIRRFAQNERQNVSGVGWQGSQGADAFPAGFRIAMPNGDFTQEGNVLVGTCKEMRHIESRAFGRIFVRARK
jgi:hypothetical protein